MLTKTITYTDYDGHKRTEEHYFNLSKAELVDMEVNTEGGMEKWLKDMIEAEDKKRFLELLKNLILKSYGEKSPDGKYFVKEDENGKPLSNKFKNTEAYTELLMEFLTDDEAAAKFVNGVLPSNIVPKKTTTPKKTSTSNKKSVTE